MPMKAEAFHPATEDPVSNVLKWILLAVGIATFALMGWATVLTYRTAPPQPARYLGADGGVIMTGDDIIAGKAGFQKADLMDYGSLYGMGSYYGEDYTAALLVRIGTLTEQNIAAARFGGALTGLTADQQAAARSAMQRMLQGIDLTSAEVRFPAALSAAIATVQAETVKQLNTADPANGWTPAYSLSPRDAVQTADFLIYSALTTVARRPGLEASWTQNCPYEPLVGNTPTSSTFIWTWISFSFTFLMFGAVIFIYERFLNHPDDAPMDPVLVDFLSLTPSQRKTGKYFLIVAALLLVQIGAGTLMAHSYYDRTSFYGYDINRLLPLNFLRDVHIQAPIVWIGLSWIASALFLGPAIAGGKEARGQALCVDLLFWVTLIVVGGCAAKFRRVAVVSD
jgi:nitric oxide reductase subunit B